jgi:hypothetical protein
VDDALKHLDDEVACAKCVDDGQNVRIKHGRPARQGIKAVLHETVRDLPISVGITRRGRESLPPNLKEYHHERGSECHTRNHP